MKRLKEKGIEKSELLEEIADILADYFNCKFTDDGELVYMDFDDGDKFALNLIKCNDSNGD